jgi:hypothetical protein
MTLFLRKNDTIQIMSRVPACIVARNGFPHISTLVGSTMSPYHDDPTDSIMKRLLSEAFLSLSCFVLQSNEE